MSIHAFYVVERNMPGEPLVIRDEGGPRNLSVTNDAEWVVVDALASGLLAPGRRLMYRDSDGQVDELLVRDGAFAGFAPGTGG